MIPESVAILRQCKVCFFTIAITTMASLAAITKSAETDKKLPSLSGVATPSVTDLGIVRPSTKHEFRFQFPNPTNSPVRIVSGTSTCGCTKFGFEKTEIAPMKSIWVSATANSSSGEGDFQFAIKLATRRVGLSSNEPEYVDEFGFQMKIRKDCSFVPAYPLLSIMTSPGAKPFQVRVINYSPKKWLQPTAQFGNPNIECSLTEKSEIVDGQSRQILVVTVDRNRLTQLANEGRTDSSQVVLQIFATPTSSSPTPQKLGECEVSVRITKSTAIYPHVVNWSPEKPRDIRLIATSRDKPLSKEDFRLSIGETPMGATGRPEMLALPSSYD